MYAALLFQCPTLLAASEQHIKLQYISTTYTNEKLHHVIFHTSEIMV